MKKLLLIIPLLAGCTRVYECDVEKIGADGEFYQIPATKKSVTFTVQRDFWEDGYDQEEAEELCEESYNKTRVEPNVIHQAWSVEEYHCVCKRAN